MNRFWKEIENTSLEALIAWIILWAHASKGKSISVNLLDFRIEILRIETTFNLCSSI